MVGFHDGDRIIFKNFVIMINLLPEIEKEKLKLEEQGKIILIISLLLVVFLLILASIILTINIYIKGEADSVRITARERVKFFEESGENALETEVKNYNKEISRILPFLQNRPSFFYVLNEIYEVLPEGVSVKGLSIVPPDDKNSNYRVSVQGFSPARGDLLELRNNIEKSEKLLDLSCPAEYWMEPKDIIFSATFEVKK